MNGLAAQHLRQLKRPDLLDRRAYVGGVWTESDVTIPVYDPANGDHILDVASCSLEVVDHAVSVAQEAFESWKALTPVERGRVLRTWSALIRSHVDDLATIMTCEQGKPLSESRGEIFYGAAFLDWFASEGERTYGETIPSHLPGTQLSVLLQPIGVTLAITPWNFPIAMITRKAGAALAAGCTMIVKPAPETPLSAIALAKLAEEAGIPPGVFQVLTGEPAALTERLMQHTGVRAFSFTGSTEIGRLLLGQAAKTVKKASLELGGHAPFIVFPDADIALAVKDCIDAKFATSGQDCLAANRIYIHSSIHDEFVTAFVNAAAKLKTGHGLAADVDIGPMTRSTVADKCRQQVDQALSAGARLVLGASSKDMYVNFVQPTVLIGVTDDMLIAQEETFGPVAAFLKFETESEVLSRANASEMGLAAYVYTANLATATRMSNKLEYGMVAINTAKFTGSPIPFGGWKQSGLGREGSKHGILEYMEHKYVCIGGI
jgi:aspartate-semialdehyde dehydrogenase